MSLDDFRDAGLVKTEAGHMLSLRLPLRPRAVTYMCPGCHVKVKSEVIAETPGVYPTECPGCHQVARAVATVAFFIVLS